MTIARDIHPEEMPVEAISSLIADFDQALATPSSHKPSIPDWAEVPHVENAGDFIEYRFDVAPETGRRSPPLQFCCRLDTSAPLPAPFENWLDSLREQYSEWHNATTIQQNFTSEELQFRVTVCIDTDYTIDDCYLTASFDRWGLPSESDPTFDDVVDVGSLVVSQQSSDDAPKSSLRG